MAEVVLLAPASITHHSDMTARYVELMSSPVSATSRLFALPDSRALPRGYYMMFALNGGGVPSEAVWVRVL